MLSRSQTPDFRKQRPLFRLVQNSTIRESKSSKTPKRLPNLLKSNSMDCSKENLEFECYLQKVNSAIKIDEKAIVSVYLNSLRKQYDKMIKQAKQKQMNIDRMKKEIEYIKKQLTMNSLQKNSLNLKVEKYNSQLEKISEKHETAKMETKILFNIIQRMKRDQIFYKNYIRSKQAETNTRKYYVKDLSEKLIHEQQELQKQIQSRNAFYTTFFQIRANREDKLSDFNFKIQHLQQKDRFIQERKQRNYELRCMETDEMNNTKSIIAKQVYMTNKFADQLLEQKSNVLLSSYCQVQNAFQTIKSKTSITDPTDLASKFFASSEIHERLINSITLLEMEAQKLSLESQQLKITYKALNSENLEVAKKKKVQNFNQNYEKLNLYEEHCTNKLLLARINNWINKKFEGMKVKHQKTSSNIDTISKFKLMCQALIHQMKKHDNISNDRKFKTNGIRVQKLVKELTQQQQFIRQSEMEEMNEISKIEENYLNQVRISIKNHSSNNRFRSSQYK